jgi:quinoprotein glucose dehydrogenase
VVGRLMNDLVAGELPPEMALDVLESASKRKHAPAIAAAVASFEAQRPQDDLGPYREVLAGGDLEEGKQIFWKRAEVSCARCHTLEGHGAEVGPALAGIGKRYSRQYLLESVVYPSKHFSAGFESVLVTMKDGTVHGGTVSRETPTRLVLRSPEGAEVVLEKSAIKTREPGASGMPDGFGQILSKRDLRNLVEFLASLK